MYKPGGTIRGALNDIEQKNWVLPAIQREFVWKPDQITDFFDSLMRGFPFGTFLFWKIGPERVGDWKFYDFIRDYHERSGRHCPEHGPISNREIIAVLDGQQRLTALNIGLRGSIALKRKHARATTVDAYPRWRLFLNLLSRVSDQEAPEGELEKSRYDFRFLEDARPHVPGKEFWFPVGDILALQSGPSMLRLLQEGGLEGDDLNVAFEALDKLHKVIHVDPVVQYYEEQSPDLERVLNIFIRLNSAGTLLSQSDLLHSIIVSQWAKLDARKEIASLVDEMNQIRMGFSFTQNYVLKAGLMLTDVASVGFRVENFTRPNMALLEENWRRIRVALILTAHLASQFGLNRQNLRAVSSLLPIAYYLYKIEAQESYLTHTKHAEDRGEIRRWLVASLLKPSGIWGSGLDTLLTLLRATIRNSGGYRFPAAELREGMAARGKPLTFDEREIDVLLQAEYGKSNTFLALSLLYPFVDLRNQYHVDHVFPESQLRWAELKKREWPEEEVSWVSGRRNQLPNLQLLAGAENVEKQAALPADWLFKRFPDEVERTQYQSAHDIGGGVGDGLLGFRMFFGARRDHMKKRLLDALNK